MASFFITSRALVQMCKNAAGMASEFPAATKSYSSPFHFDFVSSFGSINAHQSWENCSVLLSHDRERSHFRSRGPRMLFCTCICLSASIWTK